MMQGTRRSPEPALPASEHPLPGLQVPARTLSFPMLPAAFVLLIVATMLFALGPSLLKSLMNIAAGVGLGSTGLSYCNVLFVGNLCAGLVTLVVAKPRAIVRELVRLPRRAKLYLALGAVVSTIHPALLYTALERTSVINIVLLSRFNGIVYVVLAGLVLKATVSRAEIVGYAVIGIGVAVLLFVNNLGLSITLGDGLVLSATVFFALSELISKRVLRHTSIQAYVFARNFVSALIFFTTGLYLFGVEHFAEAFSRDLWVLMVLYASVAIVAAQATWLAAIRSLPVRTVANAQLMNPVFSIAFAYFLLHEVPTGSQWLVIVIVLAGMLIPRLKQQHPSMRRMTAMNIDTSLVAR